MLRLGRRPIGAIVIAAGLLFSPAGSIAHATAAASTTIVAQTGDHSATVTAIQRSLMSAGIAVAGGADGWYGPGTAAAVSQFQQANGLPATGVVDTDTATLLGVLPATPTLTAGSRGAAVTALQQQLIAIGLRPNGGADGVYGAATTAMVKLFQTRAGLPATGSADAATLAALLAAATAATPTTTVAPAAAAAEASAAVAGHHGVIDLEYLPVPRTCAIRSSFGARRSGGRTHQGMDIIVPRGTPVYAVRSGTITKRTLDFRGSLAGNALYLTLADGTYFFYAHLDHFADGIAAGVPVQAGALIGYVGSTGNAAGPHLHLEIHPHGGAAVDPYPIVKAASGC
jgi:peptidoglycan hydrolase-like protein with peptidoglycan-binding domain